MAFRGKEWVPPDPEMVKEAIKDRMSMTELSTDMLAPLFEQAKLDGGIYTEEEVQEICTELQEQSKEKLRLANESYYKTIKNFVANSDLTAEKVNIVIPVYNSYYLVKDCIKSVLNNTFWPHHITIVDDASDNFTRIELEKISKQYPSKITLLTNRKNRGFAATVNRGISHLLSDTKYTCLLNSDVLVTPYWLTKMLTALKANPRNKIVNPVTNNTAVINVSMASGYTYQDMNTALELVAQRRYPEIMPTGFCFLFPNSLVSTIGLLDEAYQNFGEETDFWMRTITYSDGKTFDKWRAVLADDTYVFHQRGASYATLGEEVHMNFRKTASARFRAAWPSWQIWNKTFNVPKSIGPIKDIFKMNLKSEVERAQHKTETPICFVTHSVETCGGMHYIADIVNHINETGGNAKVVVVLRHPDKIPEPVAELRCAPIVFKTLDEFIPTFTSKVFNKGIVVAATSELAPLVAELCETNTGLRSILHVQSYEPALCQSKEEAEKFKQNFELIPDVISSSNWITKALNRPVLGTINPGVDTNVFYPRNRTDGDERPTVMISLNGSYPFKGADRGVQAMKALYERAKQAKKDIRILAYGPSAIPGAPYILCQGGLARTRIAQLLGTEVDIFVDPALNHSYGMPALEAIACGTTVVGWDNQGIREYLPKGYSASDPILSNSTSPEVVAKEIFNLLFNDKKRKEIQEAQYKAAMIENHNRQISVTKMSKLIRGISQTLNKLNIVVVTPHLRKHGGPTTILTMANGLADKGHNVSIATVYSDLNPEVLQYTDLPLILLNQNPNNLPKCDVLITNSDNPFNPAFAISPFAKKKIMLKLSHNPRFKQLEETGLNQKWDAVVTSSEWLANVCENPTPDWNYSPVKATRIGWFHYNFERMRRNIKRKVFHTLSAGPVTISTLVHAHPSKGSQEAGQIFAKLSATYGKRLRLIGIGEVPTNEMKISIPNFEYVQSPTRDELADLFFKTDIWLGCSHTEGLGRMALEAMTGGAACVLTDTGAEFVEHSGNALVAPVGDVKLLYQYVNDLINNVDLRRELAVKGFATARAMSNPDDFINNLEKVIKNVI